jgi:GNAT superfamily N-acetyltransferase
METQGIQLGSKVTLREMQPSDSVMIGKLIADPSGFMTTRFLIEPYTAITAGTEDRTIGVIAEAEKYAGLIGMSTLRFSKGQYNGQLLPFAGLDNLQVEKDFRGQGLGRQLVDWCVRRVREEYGEECMLFSGTTTDNQASRASLKRWGKEFIEPIHVVIMPVRQHPPQTDPGITVREAEPHEYDEFAAKQNTFYANYNAYTPTDASAIARLVDMLPGGQRIYRFFVALDSSGNLLAGARAWFRGLLKADKINNLPLPIRVINNIFHLVPSDYIIRDISVSGLWYEPAKLDAAQKLWEEMRWQCREYGTTLAISFDPRDPARNAVKLKPWHQPRPEVVAVVQGPTPIDRDRLFYSLGRV